MGKLFSVGMIISSLISIPISWLPNHKNLFLFLIGIFTIYLVVSGNRMITFKSRKKKHANAIDKITSGTMLILSSFMIVLGVYGLFNGHYVHILFILFGGFGLFLTVMDFIFYKNLSNPTNNWLINHVRKMIGALIASITAFIVAGLGIGNLIAWILPSVIGTIYIIYWRRKLTANTE
ncbi:hypothetical protein [Xanthomarina sp. GH4-25]|uniref:hypothetical protein n=1 Tax=Xanthomarina sp. GH4-25 TaxID=3349335 RepID=UPI0038783416